MFITPISTTTPMEIAKSASSYSIHPRMTVTAPHGYGSASERWSLAKTPETIPLSVVSMLEGPSPNPTEVDANFDSPDSSSQRFWRRFGSFPRTRNR